MSRLAGLFALAFAAACAAPGPSSPPATVAAVPVAAAAQAGTAALAPAVRVIELRNAGFEADQAADSKRCAPSWDCTVHGGPESYRFYLEEGAAASGKRSLCVDRVGGEPW